jgi:hypothetical protein
VFRKHCAVYSHVTSKCLAVFDAVLNIDYYKVWDGDSCRCTTVSLSLSLLSCQLGVNEGLLQGSHGLLTLLQAGASVEKNRVF